MDSSVSTIINGIVVGLNKKVKNVEPITGHGSVNQVFTVTTDTEKLVIRLNNDRGFDEFIKEKWCIEKAYAKGVLSPKVIALGEIGNHSYMVLSFIEGVVGSQGKIDTIAVWEEIGKYTKLIHSIPVSGFGLESVELIESNSNTSRNKWEKFVTYNIKSLTPEDKLIELGALNKDQSQKVKKVFGELIQKPFRFGLNHGDISLKNVIVSEGNKVSVFDWGSAEAEIVPHHDIIVILEDSMKSNSLEFKAFLNGYGLFQPEYNVMEADLFSLMLLRAIDKLRWAIDKHEVDVPSFSDRVKRILLDKV